MPSKPFILCLDPAGDTHDTGRLINGIPEHALTFACAQELKLELEKNIPNIHVVLTRSADELVEHLQNANFANRLGVNLYLRLQFFQEHALPPSLRLYRFSWGNEFATRSNDTTFINYDKAHLNNAHQTQTIAEQLAQSLGTKVYAIPCQPLLGITAPAICLEAGLSTKNSWREYIQPLTKALSELITTTQLLP